MSHGSKTEDKESTTTQRTKAIESTTVASPNSYSGHFAHKFVDVNWSVDYNFHHGSTPALSSTTTDKPSKKAGESDKQKLDDETAKKIDIDPTSSAD